MVVAAATPRAGSRVKTGGRGGRVGGAAATRRRFAATRRCSRHGLHQGLWEGTGMPSWLVTKSVDSRKREIKVKTEKKIITLFGAPVVAHVVGLFCGGALLAISAISRIWEQPSLSPKMLVFGTRSSAVPFQP